jgi:DNA-binding CsgD family transcriptional regulator
MTPAIVSTTPAPNAISRFFFFDPEHWGLKQRERDLLGLLRPHLALWRSRWSAPASPAVCELTAREREILQTVAEGATNREIADQLWISPHTVRTHLQHIFESSDVRTRTEATLLRNTGSSEAELPPTSDAGPLGCQTPEEPPRSEVISERRPGR